MYINEYNCMCYRDMPVSTDMEIQGFQGPLAVYNDTDQTVSVRFRAWRCHKRYNTAEEHVCWAVHSVGPGEGTNIFDFGSRDRCASVMVVFGRNPYYYLLDSQDRGPRQQLNVSEVLSRDVTSDPIGRFGCLGSRL